ncbi:MAG: (2Fe-2S)-binding protein [Pseudomonadota bacterium]
MYVCLCTGITEDDVRRCVAEGAQTLADLSEKLGVATGCGTCAEHALTLIQSAELASARPQPRVINAYAV